MKFASGILSALLMLSAAGQAFADRAPVTLGETSSLPLRVLTRPMATLYSDNTGATAIKSNLPVFQSYFVYDRPQGEALDSGTGWYEVGTDDKGTIAGWIKAEDVFEWKQTMCLAYTHPDGRSPVLMFEDEDALTAMALSDAGKRAEDAGRLYAAIDEAAKEGKVLPQDFPVVSVEPKMAVDMTKQFYLLPILEHKAVDFGGREGRLLRVAAVSGSGEKARESSDIRANDKFVKEAASGTETQTKKLEEMKFDLVWVVDTTRSMGPYIESVRNVMQNVSKQVAADPSLNGKIAFGLWGYRDSESIAGIEYDTRNFTPQLQNVDDFLKTMEGVEETKIDSVDMPEDMFAGVADAISKTAWRENAVRFVVLVGDAPSHDAGHKWNSSGQDENTLRALADESKVTMFSMHIMPPNAKKFNKIGARQFSKLATNPGQDKAMYGAIRGKDMASFDKLAGTIADAVIEFGSKAAQLVAEAPATASEPEAAKNPEAPEAATGGLDRSDIDRAIRAAAVTWLGTQAQAQAPRDVEAWVSDKDLADSSKQALEVRILLNKRQLDSLAGVLQDVLKAGQENQVSGDDFFTSLQAASAAASRDPDMLTGIDSLAESGLIPEFLAGLPYHSQLMDMSNDLWASWGPDEQDAFLTRLEAKIRAYASIHDNSELWVALNQGDDPSEYVAPIQLELMP